MRYVVGLLLVAMVGCGGGSLYPVEGKITLDDKPLDNVIVSFSPEGGGTSGAGTTDSNGKFIISCTLGRGLPKGKYNVAVTEPSGAAQTDSSKVEASSNSADYEKMAMVNVNDYKQTKKKSRIPEKYDSNSDLVATVGSANSNFDFDLKSK